MKIWLSKNSEVSLHEQLTRQIMTAISSGDLQTGKKLPSVREIALRFKVHQNTVSIAYQWLEENGWVTSRKGSGVFVCELAQEKREKARINTENELEILISQFFSKAQQLGFTKPQIGKAFNKFISIPKPERIMIAEEDEYLRKIILTELHSFLDFPTFGVSPADVSFAENSIILAMPEKADELSKILSTNQIIPLKINSALSEIQGQHKPQTNDLIGIVSGWEIFLRWAKTFLIAVGIEADCLIIRDAREKDFQKGLDSCLFTITDSATAESLPNTLNLRIFRLISNDTIEQLNMLIS